VRSSGSTCCRSRRRRTGRNGPRRPPARVHRELLSDFDRYLADGPADPTSDGVTYCHAALWLTDEEMAELLTELRTAITTRMANHQTTDRTSR
jgi:hypothetical protein